MPNFDTPIGPIGVVVAHHLSPEDAPIETTYVPIRMRMSVPTLFSPFIHHPYVRQFFNFFFGALVKFRQLTVIPTYSLHQPDRRAYSG